MQGSWDGQGKPGNRGGEIVAFIGAHRIATLHGANGGCDHGAAGVPEAFAGLEMRVLAYDALAPDFLDLTVGVGNQPMALQQFCGVGSGIRDDDGIGKDITVFFRHGLVGDEMRNGFN